MENSLLLKIPTALDTTSISSFAEAERSDEPILTQVVSRECRHMLSNQVRKSKMLTHTNTRKMDSGRSDKKSICGGDMRMTGPVSVTRGTTVT